MFRRIVLIILLLVFFISIIFVNADTHDEKSAITESEFFGDGSTGILGDKPVIFNGATVFSVGGPATITDTSEGYDLKGKISVHGIEVSNANNLDFQESFIEGVAGVDSKIGDQMLIYGAKFRYDTTTGLVTISDGSVISVVEGRKTLVSVLNGEMRFTADGVESGIILGPNAQIVTNRDSKSTFTIVSLAEGTSVKGINNEDGSFRIKGDGLVVISKRTETDTFKSAEDEYLEYDFSTKGVAEFHGSILVKINPETNELESIVFGNEGPGKYEEIWHSNAKFSREVKLTFSNQYTIGNEQKFATSGVFFTGVEEEIAENLDGYIVVGPQHLFDYEDEEFVEIGRNIDVIGFASFSASTSSKKFGFSGLDFDTVAETFLFSNGRITIPVISNSLIGWPDVDKNTPIAKIQNGDIIDTLEVGEEGRLTHTIPTATVFTNDEHPILDALILNSYEDALILRSYKGDIIGEHIPVGTKNLDEYTIGEDIISADFISTNGGALSVSIDSNFRLIILPTIDLLGDILGEIRRFESKIEELRKERPFISFIEATFNIGTIGNYQEILENLKDREKKAEYYRDLAKSLPVPTT